MRFHARLLLNLGACLLLLAAVSVRAFANSPHDRTQFGHDITILPNEEVVEVTCFGCSVRVRGHVKSDVTVFGGTIVVEDHGQIGGDAVVFGGGLRLDKAVRVAGDVTVFGGRIQRDPDSSVGGDITNFGGPIWIVLIFGLPLLFLGAFIGLIVWVVRRLTRPSLPVPA
jgi:hypothetical protein